MTIGEGDSISAIDTSRLVMVELTGIDVKLKRLWTPSYSAWMQFESDSTRTMRGYLIEMKTVSIMGKYCHCKFHGTHRTRSLMFTPFLTLFDTCSQKEKH